MSKFIGNNQYSRLSIEKRFWEKVDVQSEDECWEWQAVKRPLWGYGQFKFDGQMIHAHRMSWMLIYGKIPKDILVCHHCDNPPCVNPKHLFMGTDADNSKDMCDKGRQANPVGTENGRAILDEEKVKQIFKLKNFYTRKELGNMFGVSKPTIDAVLSRRNWGFVGVDNDY